MPAADGDRCLKGATAVGVDTKSSNALSVSSGTLQGVESPTFFGVSCLGDDGQAFWEGVDGGWDSSSFESSLLLSSSARYAWIGKVRLEILGDGRLL